ncbi:MAG: NAD-dependent epimerase/dehydratase family protein [Ardenticatenaceae bacterium]|nr:NAD-dependent epimerase/dehydratase family protein [Anaerolineales bacterium]MCB8922417.1 NAD-dependent epimerase/dehydratase family protein [Ardenticatenaceae bacterium]MCB8991349.1 NAD-dependent epimerase/dehydratase family protein [Ardenticatenaceae bacterium]MCB9005571.1 NAD-dependent epimerase/dehydratase family protein [Ardenticatenaceae bacterium]
MNLLIIGGTRFLGRALVDAALAAGHSVTLFNRGQSNPGLYPQIETLIGDRDGGLDVLAGRQWDAVIDTCGYVPRLVGDSARFLADVVGHYTFISTLSVYSDPSIVGMDENAPLGTLEDETVEEITGETYGPLKVLCEKAVDAAMGPQRALHVRAGLIVGPHDLSDRFSYWPYRVAQGGEVLAPGDVNGRTQFIDVRDLAEWTIRATQAGLSGPHNATGPAGELTMSEVLDTCKAISGSDATFTWVSNAFLQEQEVAAYTEMPLWVPPEGYEGFDAFDCTKSIAAGLTFRPLAETVQATLEWLTTRPADYEWRNGLKPEREGELLRLWKAQ